MDKDEIAVEALADCVGIMGNEPRRFALYVSQQHRTTQQGIMGLFLACVEAWARDNEIGYFDLRNEFTVETASKIKELLGDRMNPPYI